MLKRQGPQPKFKLKEMEAKLRIGVDFGGVCTPMRKDYEHGELPSKMDMPHCCESLLELKNQGHYLVLVSFCGRNRANSTRRDLPLQKYFDEVYFVKDRNFKNDICKAKALDVLIDDRKDILDTLEHTEGLLFGVKPLENWKNIVFYLSRMKSKTLVPDEELNIYKLIHK